MPEPDNIDMVTSVDLDELAGEIQRLLRKMADLTIRIEEDGVTFFVRPVDISLEVMGLFPGALALMRSVMLAARSREAAFSRDAVREPQDRPADPPK